MSNNCWSRATIKGKLSILKGIESRFNSIKDSCLDYSNYESIFYTDVSDVKGEDWGPKSYSFESVMEGDDLVVTGNSEWGPPLDFYELISDEYYLDVNLKFEIRGLDFAGSVFWKSGDLVYHESCTYWENRFIHEKELFYEEAKYNIGYCATLEEWVHGLNLEKWKNYPELDLDLLQEYWDQENKTEK
jgi:hypothetical protein